METPLQLLCVDLTSTGEGVCDHQGLKIFVEGALPGETILCAIFERKKSYAKAKMLQIICVSPDRVTPPCPYFGTCGGCQIMNLSYEAQLVLKKKRVEEAFIRIGGVANFQLSGIERGEHPLHYRNKIQLPHSGCGKLGMYQKRSHLIVDIEACLLHDEMGDALYQKIRPLLKNCQEFTHLLIRTSEFQRKCLVLLIGKNRPSQALKKICQQIGAYEQVAGVVYGIANQDSNAVLPKKIIQMSQSDYLVEEILGIRVCLSAVSFFQVNKKVAEKLYSTALEWGNIQPGMVVIDAYSGVGVLSCLLAAKGAKVTAIEVVAKAIEDAKQNAQSNHLHIEAIVGKVEQVLLQLPHADVIYLNPPRKGCEPIVIEKIAQMKPQRIVYTSCDPATLARDAKLLFQSGYKLEKATSFDLFPQTMHIETIAVFLFANY